MAKHGRRATRNARTRPLRDYAYVAILVAAVAVGAFLLLGERGGGEDDGGAGPVPVTSVSHVHGLAVNPERPDELLVATHHGLVRVRPDAWERVGPVQDYMGFSAHPTDGDVFWASGHPAGGGNLGVIRSDDGGLSWRQVALEGVDFHAMTVSRAEPDHLWGHFAGRLHRSTDGGLTWSIVNARPPAIAALAAHVEDPETLYVAGPEGFHRSRDGGATFERLAPHVANGLAPHPTEPDVLYSAGAAGVHVTTDGGATWRLLARDLEGGAPAYVAVDPTAPSTLYAATLQNTLHRSTDGGETWTLLRAPVA